MAIQRKIYIMGYSIDSCVFVRKLANNGYKVVHTTTGPLGYPYDAIGDFVTEESMNVLRTEGGKDYPFESLVNSQYAFVPYEQLAFTNNKNGLVSYPINKLSFESNDELEETMDCTLARDHFMKKLNATNNYINLYKSFFPKWLYDSLLKYVSVNKWGGLRQSKLTKNTLLKEVAIDRLSLSGTGVIHRPEIEYVEICDDLLTHPNIERDAINIKELRSIVKGRFTKGDMYIMDNRIDTVVGYHHGVFDRVSLDINISNEQGTEECMDVDNGIVLTPMKDHWCTVNNYGIITKVKSELITSPTHIDPTVLCPTVNNVKLITEYEGLLRLYSNKQLNLKTYVNSIIM